MPQKGFDYRRRRPWIAWGAKREWPALNPLPQDPNTYIYISSEHTTDPPTEETGSRVTEQDPPVVMSQSHPASALQGWATMANDTTSLAIPGANVGLLYPFTINNITKINAYWVYNGSVVAGNFDVGIYNLSGTLLDSTGSTAQAGLSVIQRVSVSPYTLSPGTYRMGFVTDSATARFNGPSTPAVAGEWSGLGVRQWTGTFPLPSTDTTSVAWSSVFAPLFGFMRWAI